ncbi:hypothetical protein [Burkholderia savannae]|uniref:hypothetical protein n=1 Tax=Burkholderia savannae TaxID=1637837 RepID=UPI0012E3DE3E|nr:hypothetical protein [Burkholderia savannae]
MPRDKSLHQRNGYGRAPDEKDNLSRSCYSLQTKIPLGFRFKPKLPSREDMALVSRIALHIEGEINAWLLPLLSAKLPEGEVMAHDENNENTASKTNT